MAICVQIRFRFTRQWILNILYPKAQYWIDPRQLHRHLKHVASMLASSMFVNSIFITARLASEK
ncbi:hypothetical protein BD779DRAFT_1565882, partial [Infundibulicybe gibba]